MADDGGSDAVVAAADAAVAAALAAVGAVADEARDADDGDDGPPEEEEGNGPAESTLRSSTFSEGGSPLRGNAVAAAADAVESALDAAVSDALAEASRESCSGEDLRSSSRRSSSSASSGEEESFHSFASGEESTIIGTVTGGYLGLVDATVAPAAANAAAAPPTPPRELREGSSSFYSAASSESPPAAAAPAGSRGPGGSVGSVGLTASVSGAATRRDSIREEDCEDDEDETETEEEEDAIRSIEDKSHHSLISVDMPLDSLDSPEEEVRATLDEVAAANLQMSLEGSFREGLAGGLAGGLASLLGRSPPSDSTQDPPDNENAVDAPGSFDREKAEWGDLREREEPDEEEEGGAAPSCGFGPSAVGRSTLVMEGTLGFAANRRGSGSSFLSRGSRFSGHPSLGPSAARRLSGTNFGTVGSFFPGRRRGRPSMPPSRRGVTRLGETNKLASSIQEYEDTEAGEDSDEESRETGADASNRTDSSHLSRAYSSPFLSVGSLLKDTYSFMYVYRGCSPPFVYALALFLFQMLVYGLLLNSLVDLDHPTNPLHVPASASPQMRAAQGCAILIAVVNSVDIMVALNNFLRRPDALMVVGDDSEASPMLPATELASSGVGLQSTGVSVRVRRRSTMRQSFPAGAGFLLGNVLRLVEGALAVTASFILIVQSDDVIQMFMNFAALEFVVNLDNLAFALAEHGLIIDSLQDAAYFVGTLAYSYRDVGADAKDRVRRKARGGRGGGGGGCAEPVGRLSRLKGSCVGRCFGLVVSPLSAMRRRPDATRRTTLLMMTAALFGCWWCILSRLDAGSDLCRSIDVDFFHSHLRTGNPVDDNSDDGLGPFLASRSGTYVARFSEEDVSFLDRLTNVFLGRSALFLAYRKADEHIETPFGERTAGAPVALLPREYEEVVFYDPSARRWVFATCDPNADLRSDDRACRGPRVVSAETDELDFTSLSLVAAFRIVTDQTSDPDASSMALPAAIACNECGRPRAGATTADDDALASCGLAGGTCAEPREESGFARTCDCPPGAFGRYCTDDYGIACPTLEVVPLEGADAPLALPPGAATFLPWEQRPFTLLTSERGVDNTPVWERRFASKGYTDRIEFRGGTHWTITRFQTSLRTSNTMLIY